MSRDIVVPPLGESSGMVEAVQSVMEATLSRWLRAAGTLVAAGEPLAELESDPLHVEVLAPATGVLVTRAEAGAAVRTGDVIGSVEAVAGLTHFDERGAARMVEVGGKPETARVAVASGAVEMAPLTLALIRDRHIAKGDVLEVARIAAIAGMKRTAELIPLCHPLRVTGVDIELTIDEPRSRVAIVASVRAHDRTGVEMEALTAVTVAALTIYDMCKAIDRGMRITAVQLEEKRGGKSGEWRRGAWGRARGGCRG